MIKIKAKITNNKGNNEIELNTNGNVYSINIPAKSNGNGSKANGGEMLFLALATCYCNDIYREAKKREIIVKSVSVTVRGEFKPRPGSIAENVIYDAIVEADASKEDIEKLMKYTDTVAEIQNSLRGSIPVSLDNITTISTKTDK